MIARLIVSMAAAAALAGCLRHEAEPGPESGEVCPEGWKCQRVDGPGFGGVDVLLVVDNSRSMTEEQDRLAGTLPSLLAGMLVPAGHTPVTDVHVGVVSTDMGTGSYTVETCSDPIDGDDGIILDRHMAGATGCPEGDTRWLTGEEGEAPADTAARLAEELGCVARLGSNGCGFEQQLEAGYKAVAVHALAGGPNDGFLRKDSVLVVVWITDEEDCSVSDPGIFNTADATLGHLCLRCFMHPELVHPMSRYLEGFDALDEDRPWPTVTGFIVGVPVADPACNGDGSAIAGCLDQEAMQEEIDETDPTRLEYVCTSSIGNAHAARRMVELAVAGGTNSVVRSICDPDWTPAMDALAERVGEIADQACETPMVELRQDAEDPCTWRSGCTLVHVMPEGVECAEGTSVWDPDGDGHADRVEVDGATDRAACVVPDAGTVAVGCDGDPRDTGAATAAGSAGWYYTTARDGIECGEIAYTEGYEPPSGAATFLACPH